MRVSVVITKTCLHVSQLKVPQEDRTLSLPLAKDTTTRPKDVLWLVNLPEDCKS